MEINQEPQEEMTPEEEASYKTFKATLELVRNKLIDDMETLEKHEHIKAYLRFHNLLTHGFEIPRHVSPEEEDRMRLCRRNGFSIRDIAFIYQRSLDTVQNHVKDV